MRVLVADDEVVAREGLRRMLEQVPDVDVVGEADTGEETERLIRVLRPDVVLLDIQMPGKSGVEIVAGLMPTSCPLVVFVTAHDEYAIRAFELHALDYLVKPFSEERLSAALSRVRAHGQAPRAGLAARVAAWAGEPGFTTRLRIETDRRVRFVAVRDVEWIEAQDYCVLVHLARERVLQRGTLKQFLRTLNPAQFVRVHRSAAVNLRHVRELRLLPAGSWAAVTASGAVVPVARPFRADLEARLTALP